MSDMDTEPDKLVNTKKTLPWGWIISGLFVLVLIVGLSLKAVEGTFTYYVTTPEFVDHRASYEGKHIKIAGRVKIGSLQQQDTTYNFVVELEGRELPVVYHGLAPDTFKEGVDVVVEGKATTSEVFQADTLMAKCASKYEAGGLPPLEQQQRKL